MREGGGGRKEGRRGDIPLNLRIKPNKPPLLDFGADPVAITFTQVRPDYNLAIIVPALGTVEFGGINHEETILHNFSAGPRSALVGSKIKLDFYEGRGREQEWEEGGLLEIKRGEQPAMPCLVLHVYMTRPTDGGGGGKS